MGKSLALSLYLLLADRGKSSAPTSRPARPEGRLVWIHAGAGSKAGSVAHILRLLREDDPGQAVIITHDPDAALTVADGIIEPLPSDCTVDAKAFLDHWSPSVALFLGASLPPALIAEAKRRKISLILAGISLGRDLVPFWRWRLMRATLHQFDRLFAQDSETVSTLQRIGGRSLAVELGGGLDEITQPLACNNADRDALAEVGRARTVWFVAGCPQAEEALVLKAHIHAMQHAHRLLLILAPTEAARSKALADACAELGLNVAQRALEEEPLPDIQVLISEGMTELGLWYRLSPVCFMGGTLVGDAAARSPYEPAALGSAILYGPNQGRHQEAYALLSEARAARAVASADALGPAVADLIAPDKAAVLAHNAWSTTSGGAEATHRIVNILLNLRDSAQPAKVAG